MRKSGKTEFHSLTEKERQAWIDALKPVHRQMASRIGKELLASIYQAMGVPED